MAKRRHRRTIAEVPTERLKQLLEELKTEIASSSPDEESIAALREIHDSIEETLQEDSAMNRIATNIERSMRDNFEQLERSHPDLAAALQKLLISLGHAGL